MRAFIVHSQKQICNSDSKKTVCKYFRNHFNCLTDGINYRANLPADVPALGMAGRRSSALDCVLKYQKLSISFDISSFLNSRKYGAQEVTPSE